mmetsp:Transcript_100382/g.284139  ORF Transcript_100382/g.284139 Transcript_100382/m.284139 type:complete len:264 (-) Transcript_100382:798-1589(-)
MPKTRTSILSLVPPSRCFLASSSERHVPNFRPLWLFSDTLSFHASSTCCSTEGTSPRSCATGSRPPHELPSRRLGGGFCSCTQRATSASLVRGLAAESRPTPRTRRWWSMTLPASSAGIGRNCAPASLLRTTWAPSAATCSSAVRPCTIRSSRASPAASLRSKRARAARVRCPRASGTGQPTRRLLGSEDQIASGRAWSMAREMGWPLLASTMDAGHRVQETEIPKVPSARWKKSCTVLRRSMQKKYPQALWTKFLRWTPVIP